MDKPSENLRSKLQETLEKLGAAAGWPADVMSALKVVVTDDGVEVDYPQSVAEQVHDLEYGYLTIPPNPLIRNFLKEAAEPTSDALTEESIFIPLIKSGLI